MKLTLVFILISILTFGQKKSTVFYNENGEKIDKQKFIKARNYNKNLDLYFENDTAKIALLVTRYKFGKLDKNTFENLKSYLTELTDTKIDSTQNIVINYLTAFPKKDTNTISTSEWNVLQRKYTRKLHKIANINQFWINSTQCDNLEYYHHKKINWITDKDDLFKKLFFTFEINYGNYILIKPDGKFYYYLGEHSQNQILEDAENFFK
ncbi:hypothetical protein EGM88_12550 [Aureibaculum marinum]|uniref:Uncharacterized protein n=1 Tax=Aureibaculum marinum TaxID=2487930 RepID=A0A3N4NQ98_9FLAO|nr:hypothetical protein [Aureibaculum marinum]RPD94290.1 hypothetical protein EGM88_12550 [Aureibaculum marinum]